MAVSSVQLNGIIHNQNLLMSLKLHLIFHLRCLCQKPVPTIRHQQLHNVITHETWFSHACPLNTGCHLYWSADINGNTVMGKLLGTHNSFYKYICICCVYKRPFMIQFLHFQSVVKPYPHKLGFSWQDPQLWTFILFRTYQASAVVPLEHIMVFNAVILIIPSKAV